MPTRAEVYAAIDTERKYQERMWGEAQGGRRLSIGEQILLIEEYVARARHEWSIDKGPELKALEFVRKIAGIAVNCMESHGAPHRDPVASGRLGAAGDAGHAHPKGSPMASLAEAMQDIADVGGITQEVADEYKKPLGSS